MCVHFWKLFSDDPWYFCWDINSIKHYISLRSLVFPILLLSSISLPWLLRKAFLSLLAILWNSSFRCLYLSFFFFCFSLIFFSQLFVKPAQTTILFFYISFPWRWSWSLSPVQCQEPLSIVHQELCQI